jgi:hypothetical protein
MHMFSDCKMTTEILATVVTAGVQLDIEGSATLCLDPAAMVSETTHAATLVIRNTGPTPVVVGHRAGQVAGFSFRADRIADALDPREVIGFDPGPLNEEMVQTVTVPIAPGGEYRFRGDPRYMIQIGNLARRGMMVDGSTALPDQRFDRAFRIAFFAYFDLTRDGVKIEVAETLPVMLRVVVRDIANE